MKIVYLYTSLTTVGGADRIVIQKANYLADVMGHEVYVITDSQTGRAVIFPLSPKVKHIDLNINFDRQYRHGLLLRSLCYFMLMFVYRKKLGRLLEHIKADIVISTLGRDIDFLTQLNDGSRKVGEAHTTRMNLRKTQDLLEGGFVHRMIGKRLKRVNGIVTFSDEKTIFGQRTVRISNGVDFDTVPLRKTINNNSSPTLHLIGVAEVHYWHGYDRLIHGLGEYYRQYHDKEIYFHIVGGVWKSEMYHSQHAPGFHELITHYHIEKQVIFHGQKMGKELDELFDLADFAIGSLARHRSHIDKIKTLKNREYAARGIPFIYSETDEDFDRMPYILKAPADESAIDITKIIRFCSTLDIPPKQIRNSIYHLSWKNQMEKVIKEL